jgi:hypothetical protein
MPHPRLTASVIAILVTASITAGVALLANGHHFATHHQATVGVVTASAEDDICNAYTGGCSTNYDTTIRYRPPGSRTMEHKEGWGEYLAPGTHIPVYYDHRNPGDASLWPDKNERFEGIFWIVAGLLVFLCLGCGVIIYRKNWAGTLAGSSHPEIHRRREPHGYKPAGSPPASIEPDSSGPAASPCLCAVRPTAPAGRHNEHPGALICRRPGGCSGPVFLQRRCASPSNAGGGSGAWAGPWAPAGRTKGPGMAAERRCQGRGPAPDAAGEGCEGDGCQLLRHAVAGT